MGGRFSAHKERCFEQVHEMKMYICMCRFQWPRGLDVVLGPLVLWDFGFEFHRGCLSLSLSCEYCASLGRDVCVGLITRPE